MTSALRKILILSICCLPVFVSAEGYVQLVGVPGLTADDQQSTEKYVNALYRLAIGAGAMLAVLRIIFAGAKYIFKETPVGKGDAKKEIGAVIFGLLIIISATMVLTYINPNLARLDALSRLATTTVDILQSDPQKIANLSCEPGQSFVKTSQDPSGSCVITRDTIIDNGGAVTCDGGFTLTNNGCVWERDVVYIPQSFLDEVEVEVADLDEEEKDSTREFLYTQFCKNNEIITQGNPSNGMNFDFYIENGEKKLVCVL